MRYKYVQIAAEVGVSVSTVSLALRGLKGPSEDTRRRVFDAAQRIGYFPAILNPKAAIILRSDRQGGELFEALRADPFYALVLAGIEARARALRLRLDTGRSPGDVGPYGTVCLGRPVTEYPDCPPGAGPVVLVNDADFRFDHVVTQDEAGADMAINHLVDRVPAGQGIAVVAGPGNHGAYGRRLKGAVAALQDRGRFDPTLVFSLPSGGCRIAYAGGAGRDAARWMLDRLAGVGGVFVYNDLAAASLLTELTAHGVRVPEGVKLVGFEDALGTPGPTVPLSTVRVDHASMGAWAVDLLLLRLMEPDRPPTGVTVGVSLVVRRSSEAA